MAIRSDIQQPDLGALVTLYILDATALGGQVTYWHPGVNENYQPIVFQGNTYTGFPIEADGFEVSGQGKSPRPKVRVNNIEGVITGLLLDYGDLVGAKFTRKRTFAKYLDGQPAADPQQELPQEVYFIERKTSETNQMVEWELASALDLEGVLLPRRQVIANLCTWRYRGEGCGYTGPAVADKNDNPVGSVGYDGTDACSHRIKGCKLRFGEYGTLNFGGFPGAARLTRY